MLCVPLSLNFTLGAVLLKIGQAKHLKHLQTHTINNKNAFVGGLINAHIHIGNVQGGKSCPMLCKTSRHLKNQTKL